MTQDPDQPELILVSGSNGSGKTTLCKRLIEDYGYRYLGADAYASQLNPDDVEAVQIQAGRLFITELSNAIAAKESIIVESTISGKTLVRHICDARKQGYHVYILHIYLESVELSIYRVQLRVKQGGHNVPEDALRRRFPKSRENFWKRYRHLAHEWELYYNSPSQGEHNPIQNIALGKLAGDHEDISVIDADEFDKFVRSVGGSV
jgi:predicted ABC-type ATPase